MKQPGFAIDPVKAMWQKQNTPAVLSGLGVASAILYGYALWLKDLRVHTTQFEWVFFLLFGLYVLAGWWILKEGALTSRGAVLLIFGFAVLYRAFLVFSTPTLSDDMYRYIWDGRVQAHQINPYSNPPDSPKLATLRDDAIWPSINRKGAVTVYPGGAQLAFAAIWRIWPDNVHWFQAVMAIGDLIGGVMLYFMLKALRRPPGLVLIYLWHPLVTFEIAHSAHIDGLVLPFLIGAWLARQKGKDALAGLLLGLSASLKLYPILLLPALWRLRNESGGTRPAWTMPLALLTGFLLPYLPYLSAGPGIIGFLPHYFNEPFNFMLTAPLYYWVFETGGQPEVVINLLIASVLAIIYLVFLFRPASNAETAIRRCIWPMGAYILLTQILFPWYLLWLVPLLALFLPVRQAGETAKGLALRILKTSWAGWWLFTGLVALSYSYFIRYETDFVAIYAQFIPLWEFLIIDFWRWIRTKRFYLTRGLVPM